MYFTNLKHKLQTDKLLSVSDSVHGRKSRGDGGDMPPPIRGLSPPNLKKKKITLSIVKNICMYTYKDHRLHRATPPGKGYKYRFLLIFFLTACFTSVLVLITNS